MNPNRNAQPSSEPVEVHTRTRKITLSVSEAHSALASAAMEKAGINPELNDARASVHVYEGPEDGYGGGSPMIFSVTITEQLPTIIPPPDEAPTDPRAYRLGMPTLRGKAAEQYARSITVDDVMRYRETIPRWDGVVPAYPHNT